MGYKEKNTIAFKAIMLLASAVYFLFSILILFCSFVWTCHSINELCRSTVIGSTALNKYNAYWLSTGPLDQPDYMYSNAVADENQTIWSIANRLKEWWKVENPQCSNQVCIRVQVVGTDVLCI